MDLILILSCVAIIILMILSAFFSGSETAFTAASRVRLKAWEKEGKKGATLALKIRDQKDRLIGALLLGNNFVNIMASALATSVLIQIFGHTGVIYATFVMTILLLIFSEVMPKTYAVHHAEAMSVRLAPFVSILVVILAPITQAVAWIVRLILRVFGIDISKVKSGSHMELLRGAIEMHEGPEQEAQVQRAMLRSILDLADVDVEEIMTHRKNVDMIDMSQPVEDIVENVLNNPHTRLPIWKDNPDNIVGVLHAKTLLRELRDVGGDMNKIDIAKIIMEPWFIPETTTLYEQLQAFRERKEHFAVVVDEYGSFMGIVTLEDILEEIVGDIDDEHDVVMSGVRKMPNGVYLVNGSLTIRDLNREYDWGLPDEEYSTLAGLIIYESKTVPEIGQSFRFHGFRMDILKRQRNQITLVRITPPQEYEI